MTSRPDDLTGISAHHRGSALALTVIPRASTTAIDKAADGALRVRIAAPPVDGAANAALLRYLAQILQIPRSRLTIAAGESGRRKRVVVEGINPNDVARRLAEVL